MKYVRWGGRAPRTLRELASARSGKNGHSDLLWEGYKMDDRNEAILCLHEYGEIHQRRHTFVRIRRGGETLISRYSKTCIREHCPIFGCNFVYEAGSARGAWKVKKLVRHNCDIYNNDAEVTKYLGTSNYQAKFFAPLIIRRIEQDLSLAHCELSNILLNYMNTPPSDQFVVRARKNALRQYIGQELAYLQSMPNYIKELVSHGHSAKLVTLSKSEMVEVSLRCEKRRIEQHNKYAPSYLPTLSFQEDQIRAALMAKMKDNYRYGYAVMYCSSVSKIIFPLLTPVFQADAAHCNNLSKCIMFSFYGKDANHGKILLALMYVVDNESEKTWTMFLDFVKESLSSSWAGKALITDQDKGAKRSIDAVIPEVHHFHCGFHRLHNVKKYCCNKDVSAFGAALNTFVRSKLDEVRQMFSTKGKEYIEKVADENQFPVASPVCLYGQSSTSGVEGMNASNVRFRGMEMFRAYVEHIREDCRRHIEAATMASTISELQVLPVIRNKMNLMNAKSYAANSSEVRPQNVDRTLFEVPSSRGEGIKYTVNMETRECTCGRWQVTRFPCTHVFRVCRYSGQNPVKYLHHYDSTWHFKLQYEDCGNYLVPSFQFCVDEADESDLRLCAAAPAPKGRPRKRRFTGVANKIVKRRTHCSRCGSLDHNVVSCPQPEGYIIPSLPVSCPQPEVIIPSIPDRAVSHPVRAVSADPTTASGNIVIPSPPSSLPYSINEADGELLVPCTQDVETPEGNDHDEPPIVDEALGVFASRMGASHSSQSDNEGDEPSSLNDQNPEILPGTVNIDEGDDGETIYLGHPLGEAAAQLGAPQPSQSQLNHPGTHEAAPANDNQIDVSQRTLGLLSGQSAPVLFPIATYSENEEDSDSDIDSDDEGCQESLRLPMDDLNEEEYNLRVPLHMMILSYQSSASSTGSEQAIVKPITERDSDEESDHGIEKVMDMFN